MHDRHAAWLLCVVATACHRHAAPTPATPTPVAADPANPGSTHPPTHETAPVDPLSQPWQLDVSDGSGNHYGCRRDDAGAMTFVYDPVTPERSSTGTYSGGDPRNGPLTEAQAAALWREVEAAVANTSAHVEARAKGTVAIAARGPTTAEIIVDGTAGAALLGVLALFGR